jgi:hypothetical protein
MILPALIFGLAFGMIRVSQPSTATTEAPVVSEFSPTKRSLQTAAEGAARLIAGGDTNLGSTLFGIFERDTGCVLVQAFGIWPPATKEIKQNRRTAIRNLRTMELYASARYPLSGEESWVEALVGANCERG